jgi:hypothetical protein
MFLRDVVSVAALMIISPLNIALESLLQGVSNEIDVARQLVAAVNHKVEDTSKSFL